jgi:hypothetical protein
MNAMRKRLSRGDVFDVSCGKVSVAIPSLGRHLAHGDAIPVTRTVSEETPSPDQSDSSESYATLHLLSAAAAKEPAKKAGNWSSPPIPVSMRRRLLRSTKLLDSWAIEDEDGEIVIDDPSSSERQLPIV